MLRMKNSYPVILFPRGISYQIDFVGKGHKPVPVKSEGEPCVPRLQEEFPLWKGTSFQFRTLFLSRPFQNFSRPPLKRFWLPLLPQIMLGAHERQDGDKRQIRKGDQSYTIIQLLLMMNLPAYAEFSPRRRAIDRRQTRLILILAYLH